LKTVYIAQEEYKPSYFIVSEKNEEEFIELLKEYLDNDYDAEITNIEVELFPNSGAYFAIVSVTYLWDTVEGVDGEMKEYVDKYQVYNHGELELDKVYPHYGEE